MIRPLRPRKTSSRLHSAPVVLTIAGSDNSGGAGLQADLKTFTTLGVYGTTAVTCVVAEHPGRVLNITPLPAARVADQIRLVREAFPIAAIKTGMLFSAAIIGAVEKAIEPMLKAGVPLVVDPVMVASSGRVLLKKDAVTALRRLIARADLITPNRDEAALLWGRPISNLDELRQAALELARIFGHPHVLVKGGHLKNWAGGRYSRLARREVSPFLLQAYSQHRSARHRLHLLRRHHDGVSAGAFPCRKPWRSENDSSTAR